MAALAAAAGAVPGAVPVHGVPAHKRRASVAPPIRSGSADQINLWRFFVSHYHKWPNHLLPNIGMASTLERHTGLQRLVDWLKSKPGYHVGQVKSQLCLLKEQVWPQAGAGIDISDDASGKLEDLLNQVGGDAGKRAISEAAVDAILGSPCCTQAAQFVHFMMAVKHTRTDLVKYGTSLVMDFLELMATNRACKLSQKTAFYKVFEASRRELVSKHDIGRAPGGLLVGGIVASSPLAPVARNAVDLLTGARDRANGVPADAPATALIDRIGRDISYHLHDQVFRTLAHVLTPVTEIVIFPGHSSKLPAPDSPLASSVYYVTGWLVAMVDVLRKEMELKEHRLQPRKKRLFDLMVLWRNNVRLKREDAETNQRLPTQKASAKSDNNSIYDKEFPSYQLYGVVCRLEDTVSGALTSGALTERGAGTLFQRIELALTMNGDLLQAFRSTLRGAPGDTPLVTYKAPDGYPSGLCSVLECSVWVHGGALHDLWCFIVSKFLRMRGQDFVRSVNALRDSTLDSMSHRDQVAAKIVTAGDVQSGSSKTAVVEISIEDNIDFLEQIATDSAVLDPILFPPAPVHHEQTNAASDAPVVPAAEKDATVHTRRSKRRRKGGASKKGKRT